MSRHGAGSQTIRINVDSTTYIIEELRSPTPEPFPLDSPLVTSVMLSSWLLWGIYLAFRASVLLHDHYDSSTKYYAWLLLLAEVFALLSPFLSKLDLSLYVLYGDKSRRRPKLCLVGDAAPTVDIFVTCCGEDVELVMDTVAAAASQDYPPHRYRVFVLDDKGSLPLKRAIEEYRSHAASASPGPQIYYLCRKRTQQASDNFKAGNLQFGLQESAHLSYQSQFVAGLDADAIAERDWLRKSVPHLLLDAKLALINSAQRSYNIAEDDIFEPGSAAQSDWTDAARDNIGAMSCYGSGYVMRRSSLNKIGGWPQVGLGEDIMCGWTLAGHGWKIASCPEHLLSDLAPWSMDAMIRQRDRWMDGDLNLAKRFRFFLPGMDPLTGRTSAQRLSSIIISIRLLTRSGLQVAIFGCHLVRVTLHSQTLFPNSPNLLRLALVIYLVQS
ncbi:nucleotide-diphospho-sugar transferase [Nemania sp. FL0916]|nr:nucleotide-diphospho-sugar transferase [Nemania sp. FL0916]